MGTTPTDPWTESNLYRVYSRVCETFPLVPQRLGRSKKCPFDTQVLPVGASREERKTKVVREPLVLRYFLRPVSLPLEASSCPRNVYTFTRKELE